LIPPSYRRTDLSRYVENNRKVSVKWTIDMEVIQYISTYPKINFKFFILPIRRLELDEYNFLKSEWKHNQKS